MSLEPGRGFSTAMSRLYSAAEMTCLPVFFTEWPPSLPPYYLEKKL